MRRQSVRSMRSPGLFERFQASYEADEVISGSAPAGAAIAAGGLIIVMGALGYVPALSRYAEFQRPWIGILLTALGWLCTTLAWKHACRGTIGSLAALVDNSFYSAALTYTALSVSERFG